MNIIISGLPKISFRASLGQAPLQQPSQPLASSQLKQDVYEKSENVSQE